MKIDGLSISLHYASGVLTRGVTRGDGRRGEDVTQNARTIRTIPRRLKMDGDVPANIEVRGEAYLSRGEFERINLARDEEGAARFANPRNAAAGTIRQLDSKISPPGVSACLPMTFSRATAKRFRRMGRLRVARVIGFRVSERALCASIDEVIEFCNAMEAQRDDLAYEIDGVVVKVIPRHYRRIRRDDEISPMGD